MVIKPLGCCLWLKICSATGKSMIDQKVRGAKQWDCVGWADDGESLPGSSCAFYSVRRVLVLLALELRFCDWRSHCAPRLLVLDSRWVIRNPRQKPVKGNNHARLANVQNVTGVWEPIACSYLAKPSHIMRCGSYMPRIVPSPLLSTRACPIGQLKLIVSPDRALQETNVGVDSGILHSSVCANAVDINSHKMAKNKLPRIILGTQRRLAAMFNCQIAPCPD